MNRIVFPYAGMITSLRSKNTSKTKDDYGLATSILAGVGSGVFKIFEGAATLAATLADLGVDKNRAEAVEAYFVADKFVRHAKEAHRRVVNQAPLL